MFAEIRKWPIFVEQNTNTMKTATYFSNAKIESVFSYKHNGKTYHSVMCYWPGYGAKTHHVSRQTAEQIAAANGKKINHHA